MDSVNSEGCQKFFRKSHLRISRKSSALFLKFVIVTLLFVSTCSCISVKETENFQASCSKYFIIHKVGLKNNDIDRTRNKNSEQNENTDEKSHYEKRKKAFKYVKVYFLKFEHALFF